MRALFYTAVARIRDFLRPAVSEYGCIHGAGRRARYGIDLEPRLLEQAIEYAPRERTVRPAALKRQIDDHCRALHGLTTSARRIRSRYGGNTRRGERLPTGVFFRRQSMKGFWRSG